MMKTISTLPRFKTLIGLFSPDAKRLGVVQAKISRHDAVVVGGQYVDPQTGQMYLRIVGVLHPDSEHCILMVANIEPERSPQKLPVNCISWALRSRSSNHCNIFQYREIDIPEIETIPDGYLQHIEGIVL
ncbi:hypothetical protein CSA56_18905 [candidate division KSB3 bacterium]|uniref:Uncharacterized protein n=1 Tax=candidate division KSB3 bacterium TaxID=2044937 RepID=A0A2G6K6E2_9BACT|nr:MAG: hypothetical protein CSA56_18905 [candidate division KSB3 bacterium]